MASLEAQRLRRNAYMRCWNQTPAGIAHRLRRQERRNQQRRENPDIQRAAKLQHRYGIDISEYDEMFEAQDGRCAVCREVSTERLHVDHDHVSGDVRGLLCGACNRALGLLQEDTERMYALIDYIKEAS